MKTVRNVVFALAVLPLSGSVLAQEVITISLGSSHAVSYPPVTVMSEFFKPKVDELLKEAGGNYEIRWRESYGGTLYKISDTLVAIRDNLVDIGYVGALWETDKLPLTNLTFYTPFTTRSTEVQTKVMDKIVREHPAIVEEWETNNLKYLGPIMAEDYNLWTDKPITRFDQMQDVKLNAPGIAGRWLQGTGGVPIDGGVPTYYTNIQTGVTSGAITFFTGVYPIRLHEVATEMSSVGIGPMFLGGLGMTLDRYESLPEEVRTALSKAGAAYGEELIRYTDNLSEENKNKVLEEGVTIHEFPEEERKKWADSLPNLAQEWVEAGQARGIATEEILAEYMDAVRAAGSQPVRDWDK